jgi:hemolysin III
VTIQDLGYRDDVGVDDTAAKGKGPAAAAELAGQVAHQLEEHIVEVLAEVKPRLRGWLHAVTSPLALAGGIVLVALSPNAMARLGSTVFMVTALLVFTVSAVYHRGTWSPRTWAFLRRFDHANIFLLIAGTYTPFTLLLVEGPRRVVLLSVVWGVALLGAVFRVLWTDAPTWLYVPIYIGLGWVAVFFADDFVRGGGPVVLALVAAGGLLYTLGGVVYGLRRPNPFPSWFGFHEVFHTLTVIAFITHYVGLSLATYSLR